MLLYVKKVIININQSKNRLNRLNRAIYAAFLKIKMKPHNKKSTSVKYKLSSNKLNWYKKIVAYMKKII